MNIPRIALVVAIVAASPFAVGSVVHGATTRPKKTVVVQMLGDGAGYRFRPARVTARVGDVVRFVNVSGGPHNVAFWDDSIPAGSAAALQRNMPNANDLSGPMLSDAKETYTVSLAGLRPGTYRYYCQPHLAVNMVGRIAVLP
jgi:plastocyanin